MSQFDQEMWQEYVVEVEENLEELEPNLLLLEQDPGSVSLLNDCFRNMHSIKGAAGYMGLESTATLAHGMENLFDKIREGEMKLSEEAVNLVFAGIDRIRKLSKEVEETQTESSSISDLKDELEALFLKSSTGTKVEEHALGEENAAVGSESDSGQEDAAQEEDQELLSIYAEEMKSLHHQLHQLSETTPAALDPVLNILTDIERVTRYVGFEDLLKKLGAIRSELETECSAGSEVSSSQMEKLLDDLRIVLEGVTGPIEYKSHEGPEAMHEEDEELYNIFLDFVKELSKPLEEVPDQPEEDWVIACQDSVEKLRASAHYMDYGEVVGALDEWGERLVEAMSGDSAFDPKPMRDLWQKLLKLLPGLEERLREPVMTEVRQETAAASVQDSSVPEQALDDALGAEGPVVRKESEVSTDMGKEVDFLDSAIDDYFGGSEARLAGPGSEDLTSVDMFAEQPSAKSEPACEESSTAAPLGPAETHAGQEHVEKPVAAPSTSGTQTVRMDLEKVEQLLGDVGELVVMRSGLAQMANEMKLLYRRWVESRFMESRELRPYKELMMRLGEQTDALGRVVHQLQDGVMRMRMLPVSFLFNRYPRMVRDLAHKLNKKVDLNIEGAQTSLDKRVIEQITDPMLHIIRNAIDHGIEAPDIRGRTGKRETGVLTLSASQEGNFVVLKVADDGKGIDREALVRKAITLGLITREEAQTLGEEKIWDLIFLPGITTAESVSETSGRGVGMDVVKRNIERIGGTIKLHSVPGRGTTITIRIPLTLAIIQALLVRVGQQVMAVPLSVVQETIRVRTSEISSIEGYEIISLRQQTMPLIRLNRAFRGTGADEEAGKLFVVMVKHGEIEAGLGVDSLIGQQQVVIKPLAEYLTDQQGFSGATILGDGTIAFIVDVPALLERAKDFTMRKQQVLEQTALGLVPGGFMH